MPVLGKRVLIYTTMGHSLNDRSFVINDKLIIDTGSNVPGYVLIGDSSGNAKWKSPSGWSDPSTPIERFIGEIFGGGIVVATWRETRGETRGFYELSLIASVKNTTTTNQWSSITSVAIGATARSFSFGASCSLAIVGQGTSVTGAARACLDYVNEDLGGLGVYSDWYLPSFFEINCWANNAAVFNRVLSQYATDKSINSASYSLLANGISNKYWTSNEDSSTLATSLGMGSGNVLYISSGKSESLLTRPFRTDVRRWNSLDGVWCDTVTDGTTNLREYEYLIFSFYTSLYDDIKRDLDTVSYITGSGMPSVDNQAVGCGYVGGSSYTYSVPAQGSQPSYVGEGRIVPAGSTQGSCYMNWAGDDVSNGRGESILFEFERLRLSGTSNPSVSAYIRAGWCSGQNTGILGNVVAVEVTTYKGGQISSPPERPNTIVSTGTVVQRLRYTYTELNTACCGGLALGADKHLVATINYNLNTRISTITFNI